jgi:hypothetical protein
MAKSHKPVSPLDQVRSLLTAAEQNVLQSSMGSTIAKATREQVEAARVRARALRDKWRDLHDDQTRSTKRSPKAGGKVNLRSKEKHELFDGAVKRLEARLAEFAGGVRAVVGKQAARLAAAVKPAKTARTAATRASRASVRSELKEAAAEMTRKRKVKRSKVVAKGGAKAAAKAAAPAAAAPVAVTPVHKEPVGAKLKKRKTPMALAAVAAQRQLKFDVAGQRSARASAAASRLKVGSAKTRRGGHAAASTKRSQARRDGRTR